MLVGDYIYNDDFDVNCNYTIYDCRNTNKCWEEADILFSTSRDGFHKPSDWILDLHVQYVTIDVNNKCLVVEAKS